MGEDEPRVLAFHTKHVRPAIQVFLAGVGAHETHRGPPKRYRE